MWGNGLVLKSCTRTISPAADNPKDWWPLVIGRIFEPLRSGARTLSYPRSQWWPEHEPEPVVDQPVTGALILEGVGSLRREFRQFLSLAIFVRAPRDVCIGRGTTRDAAMGSQDEVFEQWNKWFDDEVGYMAGHDPSASRTWSSQAPCLLRNSSEPQGTADDSARSRRAPEPPSEGSLQNLPSTCHAVEYWSSPSKAHQPLGGTKKSMESRLSLPNPQVAVCRPGAKGTNSVPHAILVGTMPSIDSRG